MPVTPWDVGLTLGSGLLGGIGNALGQSSERRQRQRELAEQRRQFDIGNARQFELGSRGQQVDEGRFANQLGLQNQSAPLRDRAAFALMQRLGLSPSQFNPRDIFNPSSQPISQGGIDLNELGQRNAQYTPGAGGMQDTRLQEAILRQIGYGQGPGGQVQWQQPGGFNAAQDPAVLQQNALLQKARRGLFG